MAEEIKIAIVNGPGIFDLGVLGLLAGHEVKLETFIKKEVSHRVWQHNPKKDPMYTATVKLSSLRIVKRPDDVWSFEGSIQFASSPHMFTETLCDSHPVKGFVSVKTRRGHASITVG